jgi:hypothetical protein
VPLDLDAASQRAVHEVFEAASRAVAIVQPVVGDERAMTGAFISKVMEEAKERGLDITVRGFPDVEETVNGADIGIAITGPAAAGGRTTKGFISQAKRDDGPGRLANGASELRTPRGTAGRSQLTRLREAEGAGAVIVYGPEGVRAARVDQLPESPGARDIREASVDLPKLIEDVVHCRFGAEGRRAWALMGRTTPFEPAFVEFLVHLRVGRQPRRRRR